MDNIKRLFLIEYTNVTKMRAFWGIVVLYFITLLVATQIVSAINSLSSSTLASPAIMFLAFGYILKFLYPLLAFVVIANISGEFQHRTFRQHIMDGMTRQEFFWSKVINMLALALFVTFISFLFPLVMSLGKSGDSAKAYETVRETMGMNFNGFQAGLFFILGSVISCFGVFNLAFFFGLRMRNAALAISGLVAYIIVEFMITSYMYYQVVVGSRGSRFDEDSTPVLGLFDFQAFFPRGSIFSVFPSISSTFGEAQKYFQSMALGWKLLLAVFWICMIAFANYRNIMRRDI